MDECLKKCSASLFFHAMPQNIMRKEESVPFNETLDDETKKDEENAKYVYKFDKKI
jgi:hypothetical protein